MVEAAIGEAFEASLGLGGGGDGGGGGAEALSEAGPQRFAGGHRSVEDQNVRYHGTSGIQPLCFVARTKLEGGREGRPHRMMLPAAIAREAPVEPTLTLSEAFLLSRRPASVGVMLGANRVLARPL